MWDGKHTSEHIEEIKTYSGSVCLAAWPCGIFGVMLLPRPASGVARSAGLTATVNSKYDNPIKRLNYESQRNTNRIRSRFNQSKWWKFWRSVGMHILKQTARRCVPCVSKVFVTKLPALRGEIDCIDLYWRRFAQMHKLKQTARRSVPSFSKVFVKKLLVIRGEMDCMDVEKWTIWT